MFQRSFPFVGDSQEEVKSEPPKPQPRKITEPKVEKPTSYLDQFPDAFSVQATFVVSGSRYVYGPDWDQWE